MREALFIKQNKPRWEAFEKTIGQRQEAQPDELASLFVQVLFTNFETIFALQRQLPYLVNLSRQHLVVVVFFENTALREKINTPARGLREIYHKVIAEQLHFEKRLIVKELIRHGIQSLLTPPEKLSVNVINKYLELKTRNLI